MPATRATIGSGTRGPCPGSAGADPAAAWAVAVAGSDVWLPADPAVGLGLVSGVEAEVSAWGRRRSQGWGRRRSQEWVWGRVGEA